MNLRPRKTLADFLVIGITPLLIMVLVAAVAYFVLELIYHGAYQGRMKWVIFWFVIASVLVSRISIEGGYAKASVYGLALGGATMMFIFRFFGPAWAVIGLLGFIWWLTGKLTWDCTLIDDDKDASGQGLLQAAKLDSSSTSPVAADQSAPVPPKKRKKASQPHAPGMWVIYFSLLALPAFGIGQAMFPPGDAMVKEYGFRLLCAFVAAALALLLATSFLGLRRYLRQRSLQMPGTVAATWVVMGLLVAAGVLLTALLLPRPDATWSVTAMVDKAQEAAEKASKYAMLGGEAGKDEGRRIGEGKEPQENKTASEKKAGGEGGDQKQDKDKKDGKEKGKQSGEGDQTGDKGKTQPKQADGEQQSKDAGEKSLPKPIDINERAAWIGLLVKIVIYLLLFLAALWLCYTQRKRIALALGAWMQQLTAFWHSLFGRRGKPAGGPMPTLKPRPFAEFVNPFASGAAVDMTAAETLAYTYDALEAWAMQNGVERHPDQTPNEFASTLSMQYPASSEELRHTARYYSCLVYADRQPPDQVKEALARVWRFLEAPQPTHPVT